MSGISTRRAQQALKETDKEASPEGKTSRNLENLIDFSENQDSIDSAATPSPTEISLRTASEYAADPSLLKAGTRIMVFKKTDDDAFYRKAEIMSVRTIAGKLQFYVHFLEFNKRLDEWVALDRMDLSTVESKPEKSTSSGGGGSGVSTSKVSKSLAGDGKAQKGRKKGPVGRKSALHKSTDSLTSMEETSTLSTDTPLRVETVSPFSTDTGASSTGETSDKVLAAEIETLRRGGSMTHRPEEVARVKNVDKIEMGQHLVEAWYFSPYPQALIDAAASNPDATETIVYLCEFCLDNFADRSQLIRHRTTPGLCPISHPPGNEIYKCGNLSFFEIDGHKQKTYCRRLCLLSKLFLDHKTLFYDVDPFLFYILTESDTRGSRILGYFSKEKDSLEKYNLACILTLPQHQRKGFGRLLIEFSYELSKREAKIGSPEKPLSDLGLLSYRSYWSEILVSLLKEIIENRKGAAAPELSIDQLSTMTSFTTDDIIHTLQAIDALRYHRGQHVIVISEKVLDDFDRLLQKIKCRIDPKCLSWTPPVFTASQLRFL
jgi:histone acetyltransferase HTATIP